MSDVLEKEVPADLDQLWEFLHDGTQLIELANKIKPGCVTHKPRKSKVFMILLENISKFCESLRGLGVKPSNQFRPPDLLEKRGWPKQVLQCLWDLGHSCAKV